MATRRSDKIREVEALAGRAADGVLNEADRERLNRLLQADPEACERYLNVLTLHAHLFDAGRANSPASPVPFPIGEAPAGRLNRGQWFPGRPVFWTSAAAALFLLGFVFAGVLTMRPGGAETASTTSPTTQPDRRPDAGPPTVATLMSTDGAEWSAGRVAVGERVAPGRVVLQSGTAVLHFDGGATLTLNGPVEANILSDKLVELLSGRASARCPEEAIGFTLRTAASDFIDLGTEFGVAVNPDGSADVHVFEGVVIAKPKASGLVVPVLHDESGRVEADRGDLVSIKSDPGLFPGLVSRVAELLPLASDNLASKPIPDGSRIVFLGDGTTDRETHMLLINQALAKTNQRLNLYNRGTVFLFGFKEPGYQEHVAAYKPTHAVLEFGTEIAAGGDRARSAKQFEQDLVRLVDRLQKDGIEPILTTGFPLGPAKDSNQPLLDEYNAVIRKLAAERSLRLADPDRRFREVAQTGAQLVAGRGVVPTFAGYREIAAELLEAMGYAGTPIDTSLELKMLPGAVQEWHIRGKPEDRRLTDAEARDLTPDDTWQPLSIPQPHDRLLNRLADSSHSITYRDRGRGFATDVSFGRRTLLEGVAVVESAADRDVFVSVGGTIKTVWVNGERVYESKVWGGWGAGKFRVPARLKAGENKVVIEAASSFFVSINDRFDWPLP